MISSSPLKHLAQVSGRVGWHGLSTDDYLTEGEYLVTGTDLGSGRVHWENCHRVSRERWQQDPRIQLRDGDVLITKDGTIGKIALIREQPGNATLNSGIFRVRTGENISGRFLFRVLESHLFADFVDLLGHGSTIRHLYERDIVNFQVPLLSLSAQQIVADYLDTETARIDALIAKKQRMIELVSERVAAHIVEGIRLADGPTAHLGHVARVFSGTGFPHEFQGRDDGEFPFYKVGDLSGSSDGRVISQAPNRIDRATAAQLGCRLAPPGSVLFPKVGAALLGNQRRITSVIAAFDNNLMAVFSSELESRYLRYVLTQVDMGQLANPGPVPSINESVVSSLSIRVPPLEDQRRLADELDRCMTNGLTIGQHLKKQVELLRERRAALITAAVTGELEIPGVAA